MHKRVVGITHRDSGATETQAGGERAFGRLMVSLEGLSLEAAETELLARPSVGGVILFARNYRDREQLRALTASIRSVQPQLLIAVDQEGGRVQRFREAFLRLPPLASLGQRLLRDREQSLHYAFLCGWAMAVELVEVGIDFSFAPVLDVFTTTSRVIGDRALSDDPAALSALAEYYVTGMNAAGMAATGKHFPGHGSVDADSHVELPVDDRALAQIEALDLLPFAALADKLAGIMPAHVVYPQVDDRCAGFSERWLQEILRQRLGFDGVIFSDDLTMDAAHSVGSVERRAELALGAGCDMVLVCNDSAASLRVADFLEANNSSTSPESSRRLARMGARWSLHEPNYAASARWAQALAAIADLQGERA